MSILNANLDRDVWGEDAREWRPERWLEAHDSEGDEYDFEDDESSEHRPGRMSGVKSEMRYPGVYANM